MSHYTATTTAVTKHDSLIFAIGLGTLIKRMTGRAVACQFYSVAEGKWSALPDLPEFKGGKRISEITERVKKTGKDKGVWKSLFEIGTEITKHQFTKSVAHIIGTNLIFIQAG